MPNRANDTGKNDDHGPGGETAVPTETFGEAMSKAGFEPAKVGPRIVPPGKRREALKRRAPKDRD